MTVLADFAEIVGNQGANVPAGTTIIGTFNTSGRLSGQRALLCFLASNLNGSAGIEINDQPVGAVFPTGPAGAVSTQMASFAGSVLNSGNNTMRLRNVSDAFNIRNVVCFYHQDSD
jgi:hypothetical protein